jgi:hypothetical protein
MIIGQQKPHTTFVGTAAIPVLEPMSTYQTDLANIAEHFKNLETLKAIEVWLESYHEISVENFLQQLPKDQTIDILESIEAKLVRLNIARVLIDTHLKTHLPNPT